MRCTSGESTEERREKLTARTAILRRCRNAPGTSRVAIGTGRRRLVHSSLLGYEGRINLVQGRNVNLGGELGSFLIGRVRRSRGASHCDLLGRVEC